jgi:tetratricopeptide (TPR) repeat protein
MKLSYKILAAGFSSVILFNSCKKDWLDAKPDQSLVIPTRISDYQGMLDQASNSDLGFNNNQPSLDEVGANDFYMTDANVNSVSPYEKNTYIWATGYLYAAQVNISDWTSTYKRVLTANIVLEGIEKINAAGVNEQMAKNDVKGAALFFRSYEFYSMAQLFCKPFIAASAGTDPGIPLRVASDINAPSVRSSVQQTYDQILSDLKQAKELLPVDLPNTLLYKNRPTKVAVDAMLARVYLSMNKYDSAYKYANSCLQKYNLLMNYNSSPPVSPSSLTPFLKFNNEVIFQKLLLFYAEFTASRIIVDSTLFNSYSSNDLRQTCFFRLRTGVQIFKGTYDPSLIPFSGLATDEIYLIRAECNARSGNKDEALNDLNTLLKNRWKTGTFTNITATDPQDALGKILVERRKELCFRGVRWSDLRRLNQDPRFAVTLTRKANGETYTLPPNDPRYVLSIPDNVVKLSGIAQNPR